MTQAASAHTAEHLPLNRDQTRLVEAWRHEFLHVAMMAAFVTMKSTAAGAKPSAEDLTAIDANLPAEPAIDRAIRHGHLEISSRYSPALFAAKAAYEQLESSVAAFSAFQSPQRNSLTSYGPPMSFVEVRETWRAAARLFLQAMTVFDHNGLLHLNPGSGSALNVQCPLRLMQLLRAASSGETLNSSGIGQSPGQLPDWVQRRRWDRRDVNMQCSVEAKGAFFIAAIRNISLGGALLDGVLALPRGTGVVITVARGRRLKASVMWTRDRSMGVKFDAQLMMHDPLLELASVS